MDLADWRSHITAGADVAIKPSLGWDKLIPGSISAPWVVEGVVEAIQTHVGRIYLVESNQVVVNVEHADRSHSGWGEAFFQHHPAHDALLPDMLDFAEAHLRDRERERLFIPIYDHDAALKAVVRARGYRRNDGYTLWDSMYSIRGALGGELPANTLPPGYRIQSMADDNDLERRRKAFGLGFNHLDPRDWPSQ